jgi:hypothetical protein
MKKPLSDKGGEVRELTAQDIKEMRPFKDQYPELHQSWKRKGRQPEAKHHVPH